MRKKLVIIAMAVLALLTAQCKKNEPKPSDDVMVPITGTVDFGGSKTEIGINGYIYPKEGDKIYIYKGNLNVGYMNCTSTSGQGQGFGYSGLINQDYLNQTCTFMYLGTGSTDADNHPIDGTNTTISFADQKSLSVSGGKIANLDKFHVGSCVTTASSQVTLNMSSKMSIAYFKLTDDKGSPIKGKDVTVSGLYATATINTADGTLVGISGDITVHTDANDGSFYMALIPQQGTPDNPVTFTFRCDGYEDKTRDFPYGIRECNFYSDQGQGAPLTVQMVSTIPTGVLPGLFTVNKDEGKQVYFSKGNLQCEKNDGTWEAGYTWKFADNQWDVIESVDQNVGSDYSNQNIVSLFGWGTSGIPESPDSYYKYFKPYNTTFVSNPVNTNNYYGYGPSKKGDSFPNLLVDNSSDWGANVISNGGSAPKKWRTLTDSEWTCLYNTRSTTSDIRYAKATVKSIQGIILVPDDWSAETYPLKSTNTANAAFTVNVIDETVWKNTLEPKGCVFLPAAGYREGGTREDSNGYYWSSKPSNGYYAYSFNFNKSEVKVSSDSRRGWGCSVRLVYDYVEPAGK